jgi:hypothetical protein
VRRLICKTYNARCAELPLSRVDDARALQFAPGIARQVAVYPRRFTVLRGFNVTPCDCVHARSSVPGLPFIFGPGDDDDDDETPIGDPDDDEDGDDDEEDDDEDTLWARWRYPLQRPFASLDARVKSGL